MSIFDKAVATASTAPKKTKDQKPTIVINDLFDSMVEIENMERQSKIIEAKSKILKEEVKSASLEKWADLYNSLGKNPGSVTIEAKQGNEKVQVLLTPKDQYSKIDDSQATILTERFGPKFVETKTQFMFNDQMLQKYSHILDRLITECEEIDEEDKNKIIEAKVTHTVAEGTIDKMLNYGDVGEVFQIIKPTTALSSWQVVRG